MGDKSPKAKHRDQKQKDDAKADDANKARSKQQSQDHTPLAPKAKK